MGKHRLDFSLGDALLPLTKVANYAFQTASKDLNRYWLNSGRASAPVVGPALADIAKHFSNRGFKADGWCGVPSHAMLVTGGGTTEAYELIIRALSEDIALYNARSGRGIRPVIIMPVPTYGFFFGSPKSWNIEAVTVPRDLGSGGRLDLGLLHETLEKLEAEGKRAVAFYDSNPNNPLGIIRGREETERLYRVIAHHSDRYERQDAEFAKKAGAGNPTIGFHKWVGIASRIRIIDDMVYDGLEVEGNEGAFPFAQAESEYGTAFNDTFTLFGLSKAGLASFRAGMVMGEPRLIDGLRLTQSTVVYSPPKATVFALHGYFNDNAPFREWRTSHMKKLNEEHAFRGMLMKTLVNGPDDDTNAKDKSRIMAALVKYSGMTKAEASNRLARGIPGLKIITSPQAGFFHLLDFGDLKGRAFKIGYERNGILEDELGLMELTDHANIQMGGGGWMGLSDPMITRVTFAKPIPEILEFLTRLDQIAACMKPGHKKIPDINTLRPPACLKPPFG